jgi:hypothetical protein
MDDTLQTLSHNSSECGTNYIRAKGKWIVGRHERELGKTGYALGLLYDSSLDKLIIALKELFPTKLVAAQLQLALGDKLRLAKDLKVLAAAQR